MRVLDVQEQIKILEISRAWTEELVDKSIGQQHKRDHYLENFDAIYEHLIKTLCKTAI